MKLGLLLLLLLVDSILASPSKLLCWILTTGSHAHRCQTIESTWGSHCDILVFVSSDPIQGLSSSMVELVPVVPNEGRMNLFPKTQAAWKLVYEKYRYSADYFFKADDDTFVIVPNLVQYLDSLQQQADASPPHAKAWYTGQQMKHKSWTPGFGLGGAGYALNRDALVKFGEAVHSDDDDDGGTAHDCSSREGPEDRLWGLCMNSLGIELTSSLDEEGRERMHQLNLETRFDRGKMQKLGWYRDKTQNTLMGEACCSKHLVSVHKASPNIMKVYYFMFYKSTRAVDSEFQ
eukprot:TRINITY_DN9662_c0_g1_i1.p1 TRINITY_DN9662_c0_g1~~TRINITY_DN9662_c0_g1_i1.p1  ORF type:complete len:290 (-),score=69.42 TRINITY_DN9662_c0_g1_i1:31-900(-)